MKKTGILIKYTLLQQMRSGSYLLMIAASVFLGFLCVPGMADGYQIFYLGGVRGIYNSAWLGAISAMLPTILLWLPGFYMLRSKISQDRRLKIGQAVASSPISKLEYIAGKFICNLAVLLSSAVLFTVSLVIMQIFRNESLLINPRMYAMPLLMVTVPSLVVLASLTVLMDVVPMLKGALGNIAIFIVWLSLASVSVASPGNPLDLFGIGYILNQMQQGAAVVYPGLANAASFGYYPNQGTIPTFNWSGMVWEKEFIVSRMAWLAIALVLVVVGALVFDRFSKSDVMKIRSRKQPSKLQNVSPSSLILSPVKIKKQANFATLIKGELTIMLAGQSLGWYALVLVALVLSYFVTMDEGMKWVSLIMLLPMGVWSQMGCRAKTYGTTELIASSCSKPLKWMASWVAGMVTAGMMSAGILARFAVEGQWQHFTAWLGGALFVSTLALLCGTLSGNRRLFEGLYIAMMYFGPINGMWKFDFLGVGSIHTNFYFTLFVILTVLGLMIQLVSEKGIEYRILKGRA